MKIEIELDVNKIDYEDINRQIREKVAELNIKEEFDIESKLEEKIAREVEKKVESAYGSFISEYGQQNLVLIEEKMKEMLKKKVDQLFEEKISDNELVKIMARLLPTVIKISLIERTDDLFCATQKEFMENLRKMLADEAEDKVASMMAARSLSECRLGR